MNIFADSESFIPVEWFFCHDDADVLPYPTRFGSGNWASSRDDWFGPGEVQGAPRVYQKGALIPRMLGNHVCGAPSMFQHGASIDDRNICTDDTGLSSCCVGETWCCDVAQPPYPAELAVRVINLRNVPGGNFEWVEFPRVATYVGSGLDLAYVIDTSFWYGSPPFVHTASFLMFCGELVTAVSGRTTPSTFFYASEGQVVTPLTVYFKNVHLLGGYLSPLFDLEADLLIGGSALPPPPPAPPYIGLFPPGYFPTRYAPVTF